MRRVQAGNGDRAARRAGAWIAAAALLPALLLGACGPAAPAEPAAPLVPAAPAGEAAGDARAASAQATLQAALGGAPAAPADALADTAADTPPSPPADTPASIPTDPPPPASAPTLTPDAGATAGAVAALVETSVAATLAAQGGATFAAEVAAAATAAAAAEAASAVETAVAATLTAAAPPPTATPRPTLRPTSTRLPTATPLPPPSAAGWTPRLVYSFGDVRDADVRAYDPATGADWALADRGCDETEPAWAADGRTVYFQSDCGDGYDLFAVDADAAARGAAAPVPFYGGPCDEREPEASPDGLSLVFRLSCGDDTFNVDGALHLLDLRSGTAADLGLIGRSPVWSPDGTRLAYMSERSGGWEVYVYDFARGRETRVTDCAGSCRFPAWSPDGAYILVVESTPDVWDEDRTAWIVPAAGGARQRFFAAHNLGRCSWSADGQLVFSDDSGLVLADADGRSRRVLFADDAHWGAAWSFPPVPP